MVQPRLLNLPYPIDAGCSLGLVKRTQTLHGWHTKQWAGATLINLVDQDPQHRELQIRLRPLPAALLGSRVFA